MAAETVTPMTTMASAINAIRAHLPPGWTVTLQTGKHVQVQDGHGNVVSLATRGSGAEIFLLSTSDAVRAVPAHEIRHQTGYTGDCECMPYAEAVKQYIALCAYINTLHTQDEAETKGTPLPTVFTQGGCTHGKGALNVDLDQRLRGTDDDEQGECQEYRIVTNTLRMTRRGAPGYILIHRDDEVGARVKTHIRVYMSYLQGGGWDDSSFWEACTFFPGGESLVCWRGTPGSAQEGEAEMREVMHKIKAELEAGRVTEDDPRGETDL